jgi:hypothetical protein
MTRSTPRLLDRARRRRKLRLDVQVVVTPATGKPETITRTRVLKAR